MPNTRASIGPRTKVGTQMADEAGGGSTGSRPRSCGVRRRTPRAEDRRTRATPEGKPAELERRGQLAGDDFVDRAIRIFEGRPQFAAHEMAEIGQVLFPDRLIQAIVCLEVMKHLGRHRFSAVNGPPGTARNMKNEIVMTANSTNTSCSRRRITKGASMAEVEQRRPAFALAGSGAARPQRS